MPEAKSGLTAKLGAFSNLESYSKSLKKDLGRVLREVFIESENYLNKYLR
jgi:hypothetical protein